MAEVQLKDGALLVGNRRLPFLSGEIHYWRLDPTTWRRHLQQAKDLHLGWVATYVPWQFHEVRPGRFDFDGATDSRRNLRSFLELAAEIELKVWLRPGPYIYAECPFAGVPERVALFPRFSKDYCREAEVWIREVLQAILPFAADRGGPVAALQIDNEIDPFSHWFEQECGLSGSGHGLFQKFLRDQYETVPNLNSAWNTEFLSFDQAFPFAEVPDSMNPGHRARHRDYWRFQHWAVMRILKWHKEVFEKYGPDLPLVCNYYPGGDVQPWRTMAAEVHFSGLDSYPSHEFSGDRNEHRRFLDTLRWQRTISPLAFMAEMPCGIWQENLQQTGKIGPRHEPLLVHSALLAGMQGLNWYMLVDREQWCQAAFAENGQARGERPKFLKSFHRLFLDHEVWRWKKSSSLAAFMDWEHLATDRVLDQNQILDSMYGADLDYDLVDLETNWTPYSAVIYAGAPWLREAGWKKLRDYVHQGGRLVLFTNAPARGDRFQALDGFGFKEPDSVLSGLGKEFAVELGNQRGWSSGAIWVWSRPPGDGVWATQGRGQLRAIENPDAWRKNYEGKRWCCGFRRKVGKGEIWQFGVAASSSLMQAICSHLELSCGSRAQLEGVQTSLWCRDEHRYLVAVQLAEEARYCPVEVFESPAKGFATDLWSGKTHPFSNGRLLVPLPPRGGTMLHWQVESDQPS
ncbi:MAG: hypothetical protein DWQ01_04965 [Planctomycetota bacterium]|nr:MAG: hypothetical protein DWQ01_04965 [Planctomycetota bacterium]